MSHFDAQNRSIYSLLAKSVSLFYPYQCQAVAHGDDNFLYPFVPGNLFVETAYSQSLSIAVVGRVNDMTVP